MRVVVVGAGIGGLATASGLQQRGADVTVLERAATPPATGSGLSLFGNGWAALDAVGVGDHVRRVAGNKQHELTAGQRRPDGRWLATTSPDAVRDLRVVHRADLQQVLLDSLAPGTVRFGVDVLAVTADGVVTTAPNTTTDQPFDLVVAADGIRSRVRAGWKHDPGVRYAGYNAWRAITTEPVDLLGTAGETWGSGRRFGYAPLRDGRVYWFAVSTMAEHADVEDEYAAVSELVSGWHDPIGAIVAATDPASVFRHPISDLAAPLPSFRHGRCVLVGDAAHAMTPDLGQGGNQAVEDAATLASLLGPLCGADEPARDLVEQALRTYDRARRSRTQPIARKARMLGKVAQAHGRLTVPLRNAALRAMPRRLTDLQVRSIQQWKPPREMQRVIGAPRSP